MKTHWVVLKFVVCLGVALAGTGATFAQEPLARLQALPLISSPRASGPDWLLDNASYKAKAGRADHGSELVLTNGLVRRVWRVAPNGACVAFDNLRTGKSMLRSVRPEARVTIDSQPFAVGGLIGQPNHAFLTAEWLDALEADPKAMKLVRFEIGQPRKRLEWPRVRHHAPDVEWPPKGVSLRMDYSPAQPSDPKVFVSIHYELYDGIPAMCKWLTVTNNTADVVTVDRFTAEELGLVEYGNWVEVHEKGSRPEPDSLHVETNFAFGAFDYRGANRHAVHYRADPDYKSQVDWGRQQPCLLVVEPTYGPAQSVEPGATFESFQIFELAYDSTDRERRGLSLRRMYRVLAPWITENPLMHHMRTAELAEVRRAIDQAAEVGFEMIILSFGSGFNIENRDPKYIAQWKEIAELAHSKGIEIGGYSLLSSRKVGGGNNIVSPPGQRPQHGACPALTSDWGQQYYRTLRSFFKETGFDLLEHDGPYPGDVDVTPRPPLQKGEQDSRWAQWRIAAGFYTWCLAEGIYLNAPDFYYLVGSTKCSMGYREVNWSLPRDQQVIHTRQNIFDGTWTKTPSMGWMFVPLTEYHGGGAAATIEPLEQHLDHYERMLFSNLALGVQACYRGPRLYDTERTRDLLIRWVTWFKKHRDILESDLVHGRRADGRDLDWMLHVNPQLDEKGMLIVFNPLPSEVKRTLRVNLYYTGLTDTALLQGSTGAAKPLKLARDYTVDVDVTVPSRGFVWYSVRGE